jgi:glyoxylase-like metal-dependent hydrolase (beta-lactamase superfamily II)
MSLDGMTRTTAPNADEVALSVIGPGYGEALAVHLGNGSWMLVDSCIAEGEALPPSLTYLDDLGVDPSAVALVVATHWHDDHIRGLSTLVDECKRARFYCSAAFRNRALLTLVKAMEPEG